MDMALYLVQYVVILLWYTNQSLSSGNKADISHILGWLWVGCIVAAAMWFGGDGLGSSLGASVIGPLVLPKVATQLAGWLMGLGAYRGGGVYPGLPDARLRAISRVLGDFSYHKSVARKIALLTRSGRTPKDEAVLQLLVEVLTKPHTKRLVRQYDLTFGVLMETYKWLSRAGAAQWAGAHFAAASTLYYSHSLAYVLEARRCRTSPLDVSYALIEHFRNGSPLPVAPGTAE